MRRVLVLAGTLLLAWPAQTAADDDDHHDPRSGFYFGRIAFENEVIAVDSGVAVSARS